MKIVDCSKLRRNRALRNSPLIADRLEARMQVVDKRVDAWICEAKQENSMTASRLMHEIDERAKEVAGLYCPDCGRLSGCWWDDYVCCDWCEENGSVSEWARNYKYHGRAHEQATH